MNKKDEMFNGFDIDLETANRIAEEYPSLSDSARERMFNMTKEKMNTTNNANEENNSSVHGVEKYSRPVWTKFAGMAAAVALIAGGIGGGNYLLKNMKKTAPAASSSSETEVTSDAPVTTSTVTTAESSTETTTVTTAESSTETSTATTTVPVENTTEAPADNTPTPEETAHKLTDNYWDYECFFDISSRTEADYDDASSLKFSYTMQYDGWTNDTELVYNKNTDERLADKSIDGLKELYYTYFSADYDPFYSVNAEYTHNNELFGPSFTADTLPADGKLDRAYTYIMYEGELYQKTLYNDYIKDNHWSDDQVEISDVTETSFTLKRRFNNTANAMYDEMHGEVTFKIVFDEAADDWRIQQKDVEVDY